MDTVKISKDKLLKKLKKNRDNHRKTFEKALEGWKQRVLKELDKALKDAKSGRRFVTSFELPQPADHTADYDAVIEQIDWNEEEFIFLDFYQFNQFVRDDWGWKNDFMSVAERYG